MRFIIVELVTVVELIMMLLNIGGACDNTLLILVPTHVVVGIELVVAIFV